MLVNIVQMDEDYDGVLPTNRCGWREKALSAINLDKYSQRLRTLFGAIRAAGQTVNAVEFGNEDDQYCYDADVPNGHVASKEELLTWLRGYGHFLKTGALILHDPQYFPNAKIITFGIAHVLAAWDTPSHHLEHPAHVVAMLRDVDSVNYLDNSSYHVDGYGTHVYASNDIEAIITLFLREDAANLGHDKPFWVTEWGFSNPKAFPNKNGQSVSQAMEECLAVFDKLGKQIPLGPLMFYRYDVWLADGSGGLSPLADVLSTHAGSR
jgi:hypothetical protein